MQDWIKTRISASSIGGRFACDQSGTTAIEYALIAGGVSIVIFTSVNSVGSELATIFSDVVGKF